MLGTMQLEPISLVSRGHDACYCSVACRKRGRSAPRLTSAAAVAGFPRVVLPAVAKVEYAKLTGIKLEEPDAQRVRTDMHVSPTQQERVDSKRTPTNKKSKAS